LRALIVIAYAICRGVEEDLEIVVVVDDAIALDEGAPDVFLLHFGTEIEILVVVEHLETRRFPRLGCVRGLMVLEELTPVGIAPGFFVELAVYGNRPRGPIADVAARLIGAGPGIERWRQGVVERAVAIVGEHAVATPEKETALVLRRCRCEPYGSFRCLPGYMALAAFPFWREGWVLGAQGSKGVLILLAVSKVDAHAVEDGVAEGIGQGAGSDGEDVVVFIGAHGAGGTKALRVPLPGDLAASAAPAYAAKALVGCRIWLVVCQVDAPSKRLYGRAVVGICQPSIR